MFKEEVIKDLMETVARLNSELDERIKFEQKLIEKISQLEMDVDTLQAQLVETETQNQQVDKILSDCKATKNGIL